MQDELVYCPQCGAEGDGRYCAMCGHSLMTETREPEETEKSIGSETKMETLKQVDRLVEPLPEIKPLEQPEKNKGVAKGCLISILLLVGFFVVGSLVAGFFFSAVFRNFTDQIIGGLVFWVGDLL